METKYVINELLSFKSKWGDMTNFFNNPSILGQLDRDALTVKGILRPFPVDVEVFKKLENVKRIYQGEKFDDLGNIYKPEISALLYLLHAIDDAIDNLKEYK